MSMLLAAMREFMAQVEATGRELAQLRSDVERLAHDNNDQCDEIARLRDENRKLRDLLCGADTLPMPPESEVKAVTS